MKKFLFALLMVGALISGCKDHPCDNISCSSRGECVNGECDCDPGWTGPDCSNQQTPSAIVLTNILVNRFPQTEMDGGGWDFTDGPDITVELYTENDVLVWKSNRFYEDAVNNPNDPYGFDVDGRVALDANSRYKVLLYDYDDGITADDFMAGINFAIYRNDNNFVEVIELRTDLLDIDLIVKYEFN